jgi:acyl-CoA reductase-like NAD-dependent aldehyde dehydrogenase
MSAMEVVDPRTGEVAATVDSTGRDGVDRVVLAAQTALAEWSGTPIGERVAILRTAIARLAARHDDLSALVQAEVGQPERFTSAVHVAAPLAGAANLLTFADEIVWSRRVGDATVERLPLGVVAAITPWNYPVHQVLAKVVPALIAGCGVVLKPSEHAPLSAAVIVDALALELPDGAIGLVQGSGLEEGAALVTHPGVDHVSFTGSVGVGHAVAGAAAQRGASSSLELGGKSAAVMLADLADDELARASRYVVADVMSNAGQTCTALSRLIVPASRLATVAEAVQKAAARFSRGGLLGPVRTAAAVERLTAAVDDAVIRGGQLLVDGRDVATVDDGFWFGPTVVLVDDPADALATDELFGPVLAVLAYDDSGDADACDAASSAIARRTDFDLSAAVWSADQERAEAVARHLRVGQVRMNGAPFAYDVPFGGFGGSGYGREWGREGIEQFTTTRTILR